MVWRLVTTLLGLLPSLPPQLGGQGAPEAVPIVPAPAAIAGMPAGKPPLVASVCRYAGQVERDAAGREFLRLKITLEFRTTEANAVVPLGFSGLRFNAAKLDGDTPTWATSANAANE